MMSLPRRSRLIFCLTAFACAYVVTHLPPGEHLRVARYDKLLHFAGFTFLGMMALWQALSPGVMPSMSSVILILLMVGAYGAFDELSQPLVGRDCEFLDWVADAAGTIFGVAIIYLIQRGTLQRS